MTLQRDITCDFVAANELRKELIALAEDIGLSGDALFETKLSVDEVLFYAIKNHSSRSVVPVRLSVRAEITSRGVLVSVTDAA